MFRGCSVNSSEFDAFYSNTMMWGVVLQQFNAPNLNKIRCLVYDTLPGFLSPTEVGICDGGGF